MLLQDGLIYENVLLLKKKETKAFVIENFRICFELITNYIDLPVGLTGLCILTVTILLKLKKGHTVQLNNDYVQTF